jgi:hypothetical protein
MEHNITDIYAYIRIHAGLLGERILREYPALHDFDEPVSPRLQELSRRPFPAQAIAIMNSPNAGNRPALQWSLPSAARARH